MVISKRLTVLVAAIILLAVGLFNMIGRTYAYNVITPGLNIKLEKYTDQGWTSITANSNVSLFGDTIWEPGAMRAVSLKVTNPDKDASDNTNTISFKHVFYPYANKVQSSKAYLAEVMNVYLYLGNYHTKYPNNNRPDLNDTSEWISLGKLSQLSAASIPNASSYITLTPGQSQEYTLLLKMDESAGNEYQGAEANVYAVVRAEQVTTST